MLRGNAIQARRGRRQSGQEAPFAQLRILPFQWPVRSRTCQMLDVSNLALCKADSNAPISELTLPTHC